MQGSAAVWLVPAARWDSRGAGGQSGPSTQCAQPSRQETGRYAPRFRSRSLDDGVEKRLATTLSNRSPGLSVANRRLCAVTQVESEAAAELLTRKAEMVPRVLSCTDRRCLAELRCFVCPCPGAASPVSCKCSRVAKSYRPLRPRCNIVPPLICICMSVKGCSAKEWAGWRPFDAPTC